jgi:hypothetical protein
MGCSKLNVHLHTELTYYGWVGRSKLASLSTTVFTEYSITSTAGIKKYAHCTHSIQYIHIYIQIQHIHRNFTIFITCIHKITFIRQDHKSNMNTCKHRHLVVPMIIASQASSSSGVIPRIAVSRASSGAIEEVVEELICRVIRSRLRMI